jgi:hypothetical protein
MTQAVMGDGKRLFEAWRRRRGLIVATLISIAMVKAVVFGALAYGGRASAFISDNARDHFIPIAERLVHEHRFNGPDSRPDSKVPPAYPLVIAAVVEIDVPQPLVAVVIVQMLCDLLTALCLYWAGVMMARPLVGALGGVAWLVWPPAVIMSTRIAQETCFTSLFVLAVVLLLRASSDPRPRVAWTLAAGLAMGASAMFRATPQFIPLFLLPLWLGQRRWMEMLAFVVGMALVIAPWAVRNRVVLDDNILIATGSGSPFLFGSSDEEVHHPETKTQFLLETTQQAKLEGLIKPSTDHESEIDGWQMKVGLQRYRHRLADHPFSFVPLAGRKFLRLWYATDVVGQRTQTVLGVLSLLIAPLALWRIWTWRRTNRPLFVLFGSVVLYFFAIHIVMLPLLRYMLPIFPLLLFAWADAVVHWLRVGEPSAPRAPARP